MARSGSFPITASESVGNMQTLKVAGLVFVSFIVLDSLFLGVLARSFYRNQLAPIARMADGALAPNWAAVVVVYVLVAVGVTVFIIPRAANLASAAALGALMGLVVYGVYDFTNYAVLAHYPLPLLVVDVCWGIVATAVASAVTRVLA